MTTQMKAKQAVTARDAASSRVRVQKEVDTKFAEIEGNPFFSVVFSQELAPDEKVKEVEKLLTLTTNKIQNRETIKAFELFKEYLQEKKLEMNKELIGLVDTDIMAMLQQVYNHLDGDLRDFDDKIGPITDILEAVNRLRENGQTFNTLAEINADRKFEEEFTVKRDSFTREVNDLQSRITSLENNIVKHNQNKGWFGGIKAESLAAIAANQAELARLHEDLADRSNQISALNDEAKGRKTAGEFAKEKDILRKMLDLSAEEHVLRQKDLVGSALKFIETSKEQVGNVRNKLGTQKDQAANLFDANDLMSTVYTVLNGGIKGASDNTQKVRDELLSIPENETPIQKLTREQRKMDADEHISNLDRSMVSTMKAVGDIQLQAAKVNSMKQSIQIQADQAQVLHTEGVSGIAERLSVVLQGINNAATNEASAMASQTLTRMRDSTNELGQKEVMRNAMGTEAINESLTKIMDDLGSMSGVMKEATDVRRKAIAEMHTNLSKLKEMADETRQDVLADMSVNADVGSNTETATKKSTKTVSNDPFKINR